MDQNITAAITYFIIGAALVGIVLVVTLKINGPSPEDAVLSGAGLSSVYAGIKRVTRKTPSVKRVGANTFSFKTTEYNK